MFYLFDLMIRSDTQAIEDLAEKTNGKAFFVADDTGPEDINDPLAGK